MTPCVQTLLSRLQKLWSLEAQNNNKGNERQQPVQFVPQAASKLSENATFLDVNDTRQDDFFFRWYAIWLVYPRSSPVRIKNAGLWILLRNRGESLLSVTGFPWACA